MTKQTTYRKGTYWQRPGCPVFRVDGAAGDGFVNVSRCEAADFNTAREAWTACASAWHRDEFEDYAQVKRSPDVAASTGLGETFDLPARAWPTA